MEQSSHAIRAKRRSSSATNTTNTTSVFRFDTGADPEGGGHRGHVPPPPPLGKMGSHNLPRTDELFRGVGGGGGVTWSLEKVKTKISKLYIIRVKNHY